MVNPRRSFLHALSRPADSTEGFCLQAAERLGQAFRQSGVRDILWIGIGGSSLGSRTLVESLATLSPSEPRWHFLEAPDATLWRHLSAQLDAEATLVVCASKSGETFETLDWLNVVLAWIPKRLWTTRIITLTDPDHGPLRAWTRAHDLISLPIAEPIGGRFSVWSPVGSLAMTLAGIDARAFWEGSQAMVQSVLLKTDMGWDLFRLVDRLCAMREQRPVHVLMPYGARLRCLSHWWVQLWAESLGKNGVGFFPIASLGPHDQHSLMQLLLDGPDQAVVGFVTTHDQGGARSRLVDAAFHGNRDALAAKGRPWFQLDVPALDAASLGAIMTSFAWMTTYAGISLGIDPLNQPAVGAIKDGIRKILPHLANSEIAPYTEQHVSSASSGPIQSGSRIVQSLKSGE